MEYSRIASLALVTLAIGCASTGQQGSEVTRYHDNQPIPAQTIEIKFANPDDANSPQFDAYAGIVAAELAGIGLTATDAEDTELVAVIDVLSNTRDKPPKRSPVSIGIGGGSYGKNVGVVVGTSIPVGSSTAGLERVTELQVNLANRADNSFIWEGSAVTVRDAGDGDQTAVVEKLAAALFKDFPGKSGRTVTVD